MASETVRGRESGRLESGAAAQGGAVAWRTPAGWAKVKQSSTSSSVAAATAATSESSSVWKSPRPLVPLDRMSVVLFFYWIRIHQGLQDYALIACL